MAINWGWVPCQMSTPRRHCPCPGFGAYAFIPDAGFVGTVFVNAMSNLFLGGEMGWNGCFFLSGVNMRFTMVYPTSPWYMMIYDNMGLTYLYIIHIILWNWECRSKLQLRKKKKKNAECLVDLTPSVTRVACVKGLPPWPEMWWSPWDRPAFTLDLEVEVMAVWLVYWRVVTGTWKIH